MNRVDFLTEQFESVRRYTNMTLDGITSEDWFRVSKGGHTRIAWQVGHIAMGQYGLALAIPRGERKEEDEALIPSSFREHFAPGSTPAPHPDSNPPIAEIAGIFRRVHEQVLTELPTFTDDLLDETSAIEHPMFSKNFGSLMWAIQHEYTHAGQISMLYRLNGGAPRF